MSYSFIRSFPFAIAAILAVTMIAGALQQPALSPQNRIAAIEKLAGGRLGVAALDTATGKRIEYRASERFAMCSTFKLLLVAAILARVDAGAESLDRRLAYGHADILEYAPVTSRHVEEGSMTVSDLCAAAMLSSDNTAANILLKSIGGPDRLTAFIRTLGDSVSRLDRNEPSLNSNLPGDVRDTTTPSAVLGSMKKVLTGDTLSASSRRKLAEWMVGSLTGGSRLRAGFPSSWRVGDKTGSGANGAVNDIAIAWPQGRAPVFVAVYFTGSDIAKQERDAVIAEVARIVAGTIEAQP